GRNRGFTRRCPLLPPGRCPGPPQVARGEYKTRPRALSIRGTGQISKGSKEGERSLPSTRCPGTPFPSWPFAPEKHPPIQSSAPLLSAGTQRLSRMNTEPTKTQHAAVPRSITLARPGHLCFLAHLLFVLGGVLLLVILYFVRPTRTGDSFEYHFVLQAW